MLSLAAAGPISGIPVVGPVLAAVSSVADMFGMSLLGPSFAKQNAAYGEALRTGIASGKIDPRFGVNVNARASGVRGASGLLASETTGGHVGFLSGLGKILGGIGTGISEVRTIGSAIGAAIHPAASAAGKAATVALDTATAGGRAVAGVVRAHPVVAAAAAAGVAGVGAGLMGSSATMGKGGKLHPAIRHALGLGHHRRMHVTNTKALHRALRRVKGFEHVAKRVLSITHHRPVKTHFKFRKKRVA
jgi:hypothetical protein